MNEGKHYYAFISHSSKDKKIALWLRNKLDNYHIPVAVQKEYGAPKRLKPNFTYQTDFASNKLADLNKELDDSQYLIVVCSPNAARSMYVDEEVRHFIRIERTDKIIPFIIDGKPEDSFPSTLVSLNRELREAGMSELRGANLMEAKEDRGSKMGAVVDVIATMLGVRLDVLWDKYRKKRRRQIGLLSAFISLFVLIGFCVYEFYRTKNVYYLDYVEGKYIQNEQTEWFSGLFELSEKDAQKEVESYRFEYNRIPIRQPQFGRWQLTKVVHVNSNGYPSKIENQTSPFVRYPILEINYQYIDNVYRPERIECFDEYGVLQRVVYISGEDMENIDYKDNRTNLGYSKPSMTQFYNPLFEHLGNKYCSITHLDIKRDSKGYVREALFKSSNSKEDSPFVDSRGSCGMSIFRDSLGRIETIRYITPSVTVRDNNGRENMGYKYFEKRVYDGERLTDIYIGNLEFDNNGKYLGKYKWSYGTSFRNYTDSAKFIRTLCYQDSTGFFDHVKIVDGRVVERAICDFRILDLDNKSYLRKNAYIKQFLYNKDGTIQCIYSLDTNTMKPVSTICYLYNSERLPIKEIHEGVIDACDNYIVDYEYNNNKVSKVSYLGSNNKNAYRVRYSYDKNGRICAESYYDDMGKLSDCCTFSMTIPTDDFENEFLKWASWIKGDMVPDTCWGMGIAFPVFAKYAIRTFQYDDYGNVDTIRYYRSNGSCFVIIEEDIRKDGLVTSSVAYAVNSDNQKLPLKDHHFCCGIDCFDINPALMELMLSNSSKTHDEKVPEVKTITNDKGEIIKFDFSEFNIE